MALYNSEYLINLANKSQFIFERNLKLFSQREISENENIGRFTLYPTENMYNFILLDQIDGDVYQAQWSMEEKIEEFYQ